MAVTHHSLASVPGPPGAGVAWPSGVRAASLGYWFAVWGVGPFKAYSNPASRDFAPARSLGAQFDQCITNLTAILAAIDLDGQGSIPTLADILVCYAHIGERYYASLGEIDARWTSSFGSPAPARILAPAPIPQGALVELDVEGSFTLS